MIQIDAGTLTASATDRSVSGLLVPFGEECRSNLGKFTVDAGAFEIPTDLQGVGFNREHAREDVLGAATSVRETAKGIVATFSVANTAAGDQALADIAAGTRKHLSAEVANVLIRAGKAVGGRLFAGALVATPAFPSATLLAAAVDTPEDETPEELVTRLAAELASAVAALSPTPEPADETPVSEDETPTPDPTESDEDEEKRKKNNLMANASIPSTLAATAVTEKRPLSVYEVGTLYAQRAQGRISDLDFATALEGENGGTLFGALSDVKYSGTGGLSNSLAPTPQWLGQVWQATTYRQQVLPLFSHADLNSLTFSGFKWGVKPTGGDWAGNKADVPSNTLTALPVTGTAVRYAIGHDIAREFVDFPIEGFFESYAAAVTEDYARWSDNKVTAAAIAGATVLVGDALTTLPGGTANIGSAASAIIDGATAIITTGSLPDFALVSTNLYKQLVKMPQSNVLGYLNAALGLSEGDLNGFTIRPSSAVAANKVLVGSKSAVTVLELPGAPIRIDALDLARGGVDKAAFGYLGVNVNDALGLQLVTAATA